MLYPVRGMYNPEGICITGADFTNEAWDNKKQLFAKYLDRRRPIPGWIDDPPLQRERSSSLFTTCTLNVFAVNLPSLNRHLIKKRRRRSRARASRFKVHFAGPTPEEVLTVLAVRVR